MTAVELLEVHGSDPVRRGEYLGRVEAPRFAATLDIYESLFAACGLTPSRVRTLANVTRRSLDAWAPDLAAEIDAFAAAAGIERWRLHALNARTEVLAASGSIQRGECSTVAHVDLATISAQTWDWHRELADEWNVVQHLGVDLPFVTLTERGMVGKIGMNAAGIGLHFNILGHVSDAGAEGVPMHALARRILDTAMDVAQAERLIEGAQLQASTCFTVVGPQRVSCIEATSVAVAEVPSGDTWVVHTNHFLDPQFAEGDLRVRPEPDTLARLRVLGERVRDLSGPVSAARLLRALSAHETGEGAPICCHAPPTARLGEAWQTLATVVLEPSARRMSVARGGPCELVSNSWLEVTAKVPA